MNKSDKNGSAKTKKRRSAKKDMVALNVYKPEFDPVIAIYEQLMDQYEILTREYVDSGYDFSESTAAGSKKAPIVTTLESLRKDILAYASQLGLTPQGLLKAEPSAFAKKKVSAIAEALKSIDDG